LYVSPAEAMEVIPRLPTLYDEPFADSSQIPTYLVSELTRRQVTVALSGDGGDELFAGYGRYFWAANLWGKVNAIPRFLRHLCCMQPHDALTHERGLRFSGHFAGAA
jgi:asparagine synthase (glutamine-hydrolysing)